MLVKDRPEVLLAMNSARDFSSSATVTVIQSCAGMKKVTLEAKFTDTPGNEPAVSFGMDGVNFDRAEEAALSPDGSNLYEGEFSVGAARYVKVVLTAPAGAGNSARANVLLWPKED